MDLLMTAVAILSDSFRLCWAALPDFLPAAGVRQALIVIVAADGTTEVYRRQTTRLYNSIRLPDGSHGKRFIVKAAFLRHVGDEPLFGPEQTFSMPLATTDLAAARR